MSQRFTVPKAGAHDYTHRAGTESVTFRLVVAFKSYGHPRTDKRGTKKRAFATWKVRLDPTAVRNTYRTRFGIEASYRQLNQSRARTSTRDPLYRLLLVGLALFLRNVWQWLARAATPAPRGPATDNPRTPPTRYQNLLDALSDDLQERSLPALSSPLTAGGRLETTQFNTRRPCFVPLDEQALGFVAFFWPN